MEYLYRKKGTYNIDYINGIEVNLQLKFGGERFGQAITVKIDGRNSDNAENLTINYIYIKPFEEAD